VKFGNLEIVDRGIVAHGPVEKRDYRAMARYLAALSTIAKEHLPWLKGDLIRLGEETVPDHWSQFIEFTEDDLHPLYKLTRDSKAFPLELRGILPYSFYAAIPSKRTGDAKAILEEAKAEGLTVAEFRRKMRGIPDYKARCVPKMIGRSKKFADVIEKFDELYTRNEQDWVASPTEREMCRKSFKKALEVAEVCSHGRRNGC